MIRLKPSVCSRSSAASAMLCTTADIPLLPDRFLIRTSPSFALKQFFLKQLFLEQLLAVGLDIGGQAERVVAGALFREFGVASLERLDDRQMLGQRGRGAILSSDGQLPVTAHMQQDVIGHVDQ